ncbi:MAG: hypothetical protein MZW92_19065 [Comamonadaceae bacterium]|nr:hypothetical protein [Comamonadaceae bacterium]
MPNTPALIGRGIAGLYARDAVERRRARRGRGAARAHRRTLWVGARGRPRRRDGAVGLGPGLRVLLRSRR